MGEAIAKFISDLFGPLGSYISVLFVSMLPIVELRGAIPVAKFLFDMNWYVALPLAIAGNLLPVPFILLLIRKILSWMKESRVKIFRLFAGWLERKVDKHKDSITRYAVFSLAIFVAIPLPGTGAWTGALVAGLIGMKFWPSIASITAGVFGAGILVTALTYFLAASSWWVWLGCGIALVIAIIAITIHKRLKLRVEKKFPESKHL